MHPNRLMRMRAALLLFLLSTLFAQFVAKKRLSAFFINAEEMLYICTSMIQSAQVLAHYVKA